MQLVVCDVHELTCVCVCFRSMMGQISSNEEQMVELTDKIAAMEEELKRVREVDFDPQTF